VAAAATLAHVEQGARWRGCAAAGKAARARRGTRERDVSERMRWRGEARGKDVRQTGRGCAGEHAGRACAGTGVRGGGAVCAGGGLTRRGTVRAAPGY